MRRRGSCRWGSGLRPLALVLALAASVAAGGDSRETRRLLASREADDRIEGVRRLGDIAGRTALRLLLGALADDEPEVRDVAERVLSKRRGEEDLGWLARDGLSHREPRVRTVCLRLLAKAGASGLEEVLDDALEDRDPGVREAAVGIVFEILGARGTHRLAAAVDHGREGRPRAAALLALSDLDPETAAEWAGVLRQFPAFEVRVAALEVLADAGGSDALEILADGLADESWSVRLTAARGLVRLARPGAIPPLIEALRREEGRLLDEVNGALAALTGAGLPPDPERWARWWEENRAEFRPRAPAPSERPAGEDQESVATFHSIPVTSRGVAFVLDRSQSMRRSVDRKDATTKAAMVEAELARTLARLSAPTRLYLVAFGTDPVAFHRRPLPATAGVRRKALQWFAERKPEGRTNLHDALALALDQPEVDTIYVLTDGAPSEGEERTRTGILDSIGRKNRYRKAVIHTVEIGGETTSKRWDGFLAEMARRTGGRHVRR